MSDTALHKDMNTPVAEATYLAKVESVDDPQGHSRVQIKLLSFDGVTDQDALLWARVAVPFAGDNRGAFMIPDLGDEVLVTFVNGDTRFPVVIGGLWSASAQPPEQLGGDGKRVDRWALKGKAGTRIAIEEESTGTETISLTTPGGTKVELTESGGGQIELRTGGTSVTLTGSNVNIETSLDVRVAATSMTIDAPMLTVNAGMSIFNGVIQAQTVIGTSAIFASYTPGAGNIW